jgi:lysophospholipid acyltransferase (LPLAT)-like uncharacterized protein
MRLRDVLKLRFVQRSAGFLLADYIRLIRLTNRVSYDPPDLRSRLDAITPVILAFWHGQHLLVPLPKEPKDRFKVMISRHRDGEINAIAAERFGIGAVRGSGDHGAEFWRKGGFSAFKTMLREIANGFSLAMTADVPKVSRVAGLGIIMMARMSGRPILPLAIASSRFKRLNNWDRSVIALPFGRVVIASGAPVSVPRDADDAMMERLRSELEDNLNETTRRAYALVGRTDEPGRREYPQDKSFQGGAGDDDVTLTRDSTR